MNVVRLEPKSARNGAYGAVPHDHYEGAARALLAAIRAELDGADFFTREDMLHLGVFDHISTISKYRRLCYAVRHLVATGGLVEKSRTDFCLPGKSRAYPGGPGPLAEQFADSVRRLVGTVPRDRLFSVGEVVKRWTTDPHLTTNVKRVIVRRVLAEMVRNEALARGANENEYIRRGGAK